MNKNATPETFSKQLTNGSHLTRFTAKGRTKMPINAETALMTSPTSGALSSALMCNCVIAGMKMAASAQHETEARI
jgi:hypothetical protein